MELKDKVVLPVASSGSGRAVAHNLNETGVKLILAGRRENRLAELKGELKHSARRYQSGWDAAKSAGYGFGHIWSL